MDDTLGPTLLQLDDRAVDLQRRLVLGAGDPVPLTCREAALLVYLAARAGRTVPRDEALREVFGYSDRVLSRAVDCVVRRLRAKIEADPDNPAHLLTDFGVGYRLSFGAVVAPAPAPEARPRLGLSGGEVDLDAGTIRRAEGLLPLVGNELALLRALVRAEGHTLEAHELERLVWGRPLARSNRLRCLVWRLRNKIERDPLAPRHLLSRRGGGYRFCAEGAAVALDRAAVLAASIPAASCEATEALWRAARDVAERAGAQVTNLAFGQVCLVAAGPLDDAAQILRAAVPGVRVGLAAGQVRRVGESYVGEAVARATALAASGRDPRRGDPPGPLRSARRRELLADPRGDTSADQPHAVEQLRVRQRAVRVLEVEPG